MIERFGPLFTHALIDYDFIGERKNGGDIVKAQREKNRFTRIACVTARAVDSSFAAATDDTLSAGADTAISTKMEDCEAQIWMLFRH